MGRHIPTGQLVAVKHTNLDECTEEELLQLMVSPLCLICILVLHLVCQSCWSSDCVSIPQNEVLLSRLFRHPSLLTSRLVFSSCCQLWVLTPLMAYGKPPPQPRRLSSVNHCQFMFIHTSKHSNLESLPEPLRHRFCGIQATCLHRRLQMKKKITATFLQERPTQMSYSLFSFLQARQTPY